METENKKLTKDELEYLKEYFIVFARAYMLQTGNKLTTVEQVIEVINKGDFTFDDVFDSHLDTTLFHLPYKTNIYWDDNMSLFSRENYFPYKDKRIGEGAWIKIRTENGFEVHYAKVSNRKRRFHEEHEKIGNQLLNLFKRKTKELKNVENKVDDVLSPAVKAKQKALEDTLKCLEIRQAIGLKLYEVKIQRTKSVIEYYLPSQYEIVQDIDEFSDAYVSSLPGISIKSLYSSQNKDAVFYLQSRGISKKVAEMMAALKQTYFKVNMVEAIDAYNEDIRKRVVFVEAGADT